MTETAEKVYQFRDAPAAFSWAEEILSRYPVESQISKLDRVPSGGEFSLDELRDQALTIVSVASRVKPQHAGLAFRYVYGRGDNLVITDLVDALMRHVYATVSKARGKHPHRLTNLVNTLLQGFRRYTQYHEKQINAQLAGVAHVTRQSFTESGWMDIVHGVRGILNDWLRIANDAITQELIDKGFIP
jgi:hypothetical protein